MFCQKCGKEIPNEANVCPYCGVAASSQNKPVQNQPANKKGKKKKGCLIAVIAVVAIFILIVTIAALSGGNDTNTDTPTNNPEIVSDQTGNSSSTQKSTQPKSTQPKVSVEFQNALITAKNYSDSMHLSKKGIYNQLVSEYGEGFSAEAAQYAIDNLKADYKKNALETAKNYQNTMHMSKNAIYDQLVSEYGEKFTAEEAQYAIDNLPN